MASSRPAGSNFSTLAEGACAAYTPPSAPTAMSTTPASLAEAQEPSSWPSVLYRRTAPAPESSTCTHFS